MPPARRLLSGVYCIRNTINNKRYIGSATKSARQRLGIHCRQLKKGVHCNKHLQRAWNLYGEEAFEFSVVEHCMADACLNREQFWMDHFDSTNGDRGYNICREAGSRRGVKHSSESRAKIAESVRALWADTEQRTERLTRFRSDENRARISERSREAMAAPEERARKAAATRKRYESAEAKAEHSQRMREVLARPEVQAKRSEAMRKVWQSEEHRAKVSRKISHALRKHHNKKQGQLTFNFLDSREDEQTT